MRLPFEKVAVSGLDSALFSFSFSPSSSASHLLCAFIHKRKQTGKEIYNRAGQDDKIILIDSHCRCRLTGVFFDELAVKKKKEEDEASIIGQIKVIFLSVVFVSFEINETYTFDRLTTLSYRKKRNPVI